MPTQSAIQRPLSPRESNIRWDRNSPLTQQIETRQGPLKIRYGRFVGGASDQVEVIEVDTGKTSVMILPTRGMGIWRMRSGDVDFGWESPVTGPVHPSRVPLSDADGLGWLEGFDELVVRCGLESNGAPELDAHGHVVHPLHGRIANLAADSLWIEYSEASGRLDVIGEVIESKLFFKRLRLRSRTRFHAGSADVELLDDVTNDLSQPASMQLLYHINLGAPVLGEGAVVDAPLETLAPKDSLSASEIDHWNQMGAPQSGYSERVYFAKLHGDEHQITTAMLRSADKQSGLAVSFNVSGLPRFILWKNTAAESDGYVVGMEPATNFPNTRSFEAKHGRTVELAPGQTQSFRLKLSPLSDAAQVAAHSEAIAKLKADIKPEIHNGPKPGWTPGA